MAWTEVTPARTDIAIEPGEVVSGWAEIVPARKMLIVNPEGPACTPGETECLGYNLYTCSVEGQWQLTEKNSEQCGYTPPPEEGFPWKYIAIGGGIFLGIMLLFELKGGVK